MTIPNVDTTTLTNLVPNLDTGDTADPALRLAAFQYVYAELAVIIAELNNIPAANLRDLSVTTGKIANLAVVTGKIADLAITTGKLNNLAITLEKMAANSVGTTQLIDASVIASKIMDGVLTAAKFAPGSLTNETQNALRITVIEDKLDSDLSPIPTTLTLGTNVYNITNYSALDKLEMDGRTLVNLLGKDGNCLAIGRWINTGSEIVVITTDSVLGGSCFEIRAGDYWHTLDITNQVISGRHYLIAGSTKSTGTLGNGTIGFQVYDADSAAIVEIIDNTFHTDWQLKLKTFTSPTSANLSIRIARTNQGSNTNYARFDSIRLFEITSAEKTYIDGLSAAAAQSYIATNYPYFDSMQSIFNPYVISEGKNLIPQEPYDYNEGGGSGIYPNKWINGRLAIYNGDSDYNGKGCIATVVPNQTYTFSALFEDSIGGSKSSIIIGYSGTTGAVLTNNLRTGFQSFTFTPTQSPIYIRFTRSGTSSTADPTFISNMQLETGSISTNFTEKNQSYTFIQDTFRSNVDGSVKDKLFHDGNGNPRKIKRINEVVFDELISWAYNTDGIGFKIINIPITNYVPNIGYLVNHDGKVIPRYPSGFTITAGNQFIVHTNGNVYIAINDNDSGWGETFTPSIAEIKAGVSLGWKMNNGVFGTNYNGSGTKTWIPWGATDNTGAVTVVPTTVSSAITSGTYSYYKLQYQLAQSVDVAVTFEGALQVFDGANQITLGAGVIAREIGKVTPYLTTEQLLNATNYPTSLFNYRSAKIHQIYKGTEPDNNWIIQTGGDSYGIDKASISNSKFDAESAYSVTYFALDMYKLGIAPQSITASYEGNLAKVVQANVSDIVDAKMQISVIKNNYALKQQPNAITMSMLASWGAFSGNTAGYWKDEFSMCWFTGIISGGTVTNGTIIAYVGYKPAKAIYASVLCYTGSAWQTAEIIIGTNGSLTINNVPASGRIYLDSIRPFKVA